MKFSSEKTYIEFEDRHAEETMLRAVKDMLKEICYRMDEDSYLSADDYGLYAPKKDVATAMEILRVLCEYDNCYIE